jgi:hypothetical protein
MKHMNYRVISAIALIAAGNAYANCEWEWLCNGDGSCKQLPVCETLYDTPSPPPGGQPPTPPISMRPSKLPGNMGPAQCEYIMRQTKGGRWVWDEACFCSDSSKTRDPDAPLANIVRCTPPWEKQ